MHWRDIEPHEGVGLELEVGARVPAFASTRARFVGDPTWDARWDAEVEGSASGS